MDRRTIAYREISSETLPNYQHFNTFCRRQVMADMDWK